jgi:hypothetical protein
VYHASGDKCVRVTKTWNAQLRWAGLFVLALLVLAPGQAQAKKLVISEAFEITGKIQRPQAMYILQRSKLNLKGLQLRRSLIPKLLESMRKPPL